MFDFLKSRVFILAARITVDVKTIFIYFKYFENKCFIFTRKQLFQFQTKQSQIKNKFKY